MKVHRNIQLLTGFNFFTDFKLYAPVAIIYFAKITGSYAAGMSIFSIAMISSALFEIPTGIFSDMIGRKKTMMFGAASAVMYSIFYAIGGSFTILFVGALFEGLARSFYSGNNSALLHDTLAQSHEEHLYSEFEGRSSAMFQVALAISAIVGGFIAGWSFALIMWISVIPQIVCLYISCFITEPPLHSGESGNMYHHLKDAIQQFLHNRKLRLLSITSILTYGLGEASYQFQSAFYGTLWPIWAIGLAKTLSNVTASISYHVSGRVIRKFGAVNMMILSNMYNYFINSIAVVFPSIYSPILMGSTSLFYGISSVSESTLFQREFKPHQRATMGSLNSFAGSIFFGIVSILLGFLADSLSPAKALLIFQILLHPTLYLYWKLYAAEKASTKQ